MAYDLLIIGSGLSGLFAACCSARRGKRVLLIARGIGSTHIGAGTIGVMNNPADLEAAFASPDHPYAKAGRRALEAALAELQTICAEHDYPLHGELMRNLTLPTAAGSTRQTCLAPQTMIAGDLARPEPFALAGLPGFRDFDAALAAANLNVKSIPLPLPGAPAHRDSYATDLALLLDRPDYREALIAAWKPLLKNAPPRLGLPAILGLAHSAQAHGHLQSALGLELFEIPLLPPSVPGMRLFDLLRDDLAAHGGRLILGPTATGQIHEGRATVTADANGRTKTHTAETIVLATGGFLHGGLAAESNGAVHETVFNLPVDTAGLGARTHWTSEVFFGPHPFSRFGIRVNNYLQPLDASGKPAAHNLLAIGSLLAAADRLTEGSREGIELATAWKATQT
nr:anaerobic glycerol-3-phosphate dehydrogenase subunit B [Chloroflexota bacterium]